MKLFSPRSQGVTLPEVHSTREMPALHEPEQPQGLLRAFVALRHRNYRYYWFGQMVSLIGTWMQTTGLAWLVLLLTNSAWELGLVGAIQFLPVLLFAIFGGVFADRWPKRNVLLVTQSGAMVLAVILWALIATHLIQMWEVYVLALLLGLTNALDMPARQAFVVEMVGREDLPNAVALNSSSFNLARILGPGVAGLIIAISGVTSLFLLNAVSFIAVLGGLIMIRNSELYAAPRLDKGQERTKTWQSLREGIVYIRQTPSVKLIILLIGAISLFGINFNVVLPLFATQVLNAGPAGFGFISSAFGIGSLFSALWIAWGNKQPSIRRMLISMISFCSLLLLFALSRNYPLSLVLIAAVGFSQIAFSALANTAIQSVTPDHLRGRVMSVYMAFFAGSTPIGNLLVGGLTLLMDPSLMLLVCAILALGSAVTGWVLRKPAEKDFAKSVLF